MRLLILLAVTVFAVGMFFVLEADAAPLAGESVFKSLSPILKIHVLNNGDIVVLTLNSTHLSDVYDSFLRIQVLRNGEVIFTEDIIGGWMYPQTLHSPFLLPRDENTIFVTIPRHTTEIDLPSNTISFKDKKGILVLQRIGESYKLKTIVDHFDILKSPKIIHYLYPNRVLDQRITTEGDTINTFYSARTGKQVQSYFKWNGLDGLHRMGTIVKHDHQIMITHDPSIYQPKTSIDVYFFDRDNRMHIIDYVFLHHYFDSEQLRRITTDNIGLDRYGNVFIVLGNRLHVFGIEGDYTNIQSFELGRHFGLISEVVVENNFVYVNTGYAVIQYDLGNIINPHANQVYHNEYHNNNLQLLAPLNRIHIQGDIGGASIMASSSDEEEKKDNDEEEKKDNDEEEKKDNDGYGFTYYQIPGSAFLNLPSEVEPEPHDVKNCAIDECMQCFRIQCSQPRNVPEFFQFDELSDDEVQSQNQSQWCGHMSCLPHGPCKYNDTHGKKRVLTPTDGFCKTHNTGFVSKGGTLVPKDITLEKIHDISFPLGGSWVTENATRSFLTRAHDTFYAYAVHDGYAKAVQFELAETANGIQLKPISAVRNDTSGFPADVSLAGTNTEDGYGISSVQADEIGHGTKSWPHFVDDAIIQGISTKDITGIDAKLGGAWISNKSSPVFVKFHDDDTYIAVTHDDDGYAKIVKFLVKGVSEQKAVMITPFEAGYIALDDPEKIYVKLDSLHIAQSERDDGYGISSITIHHKTTETKQYGFVSSNGITFPKNIENIKVNLGGKWIGAQVPAKIIPAYGTYYSYVIDDGYLKAVKFEISLTADGIKIKPIGASYLQQGSTIPHPIPLASSQSDQGYGIASVNIAYENTRTKFVSSMEPIINKNTVSIDAVCLDGAWIARAPACDTTLTKLNGNIYYASIYEDDATKTVAFMVYRIGDDIFAKQLDSFYTKGDNRNTILESLQNAARTKVADTKNDQGYRVLIKTTEAGN